MRMSIERSNGSHSRLRVCVSSWSRDSTWLGCSANTRSRSNSMLVSGSSSPSGRAAGACPGRAVQRPIFTRRPPAAALAGFAAAARAPQHALQARAQLARVEGLAEVVVGADLQADHAVHHLARRRHHDDRHVVVARAASARATGRPRPGRLRSSSTTSGTAAAQRLAHGLAVLGEGHLVAVALQVLAHRLAHVAVVVDDEDAFGGHGRSLHGGNKLFPDRHHAQYRAGPAWRPST